jgi:hypothetical protein
MNQRPIRDDYNQLFPKNQYILYSKSKNVTAIYSSGFSTNENRSAKTGRYPISILLFGYWNSVVSNNFFGQNIPYEGILVY